MIYVYGRPISRPGTFSVGGPDPRLRVGGAGTSAADAALLAGAGLALFMFVRALGIA